MDINYGKSFWKIGLKDCQNQWPANVMEISICHTGYEFIVSEHEFSESFVCTSCVACCWVRLVGSLVEPSSHFKKSERLRRCSIDQLLKSILDCAMMWNKRELSRDYISQIGGIYRRPSKMFSRGVGVSSRSFDTKKSRTQFWVEPIIEDLRFILHCKIQVSMLYLP